MKKLASVLLGLSLVVGSASFAFAQDKPKEEPKKEKGKGKKAGKKKGEEKKEEKK